MLTTCRTAQRLPSTPGESALGAGGVRARKLRLERGEAVVEG